MRDLVQQVRALFGWSARLSAAVLVDLPDSPLRVRPPAWDPIEHHLDHGYTVGMLDAAGRAWEEGWRSWAPIIEPQGDHVLAAFRLGYDRGCEDGIELWIGAPRRWGRPPWRDQAAALVTTGQGIAQSRKIWDYMRESGESWSRILRDIQTHLETERQRKAADDLQHPELV